MTLRKPLLFFPLLLALPSMAAAAELAVANLPHDLSPLGMFMNADWVVKAVMLGLAFASVLSWTVWLVKALDMLRRKRQIKQALEACGQAQSLTTTATQTLPAVARQLLSQATAELSMSDGLAAAGIKERVESRLEEQESRTHQTLLQGTGVLATIGSTAPFVGLFGTVWGIMNSFIGISESHTTNLAVVAPGIAEALLATAMGLVAAIPAVILYNLLARQIGGYRAQLRQLAKQVMRLVSRDLDTAAQGEGRRHGHEAA